MMKVKKTSLADLIRSNLKFRPVYGFDDFKEDLTKSYDRVNWGLCYRFLNKGEGPDPFALMRTDISRFTGFHYPKPGSYPSYFLGSHYRRSIWPTRFYYCC